ncbi:MAG: hypothetical protein OHK0011_02040 [Turneriella sp.]
MYPAQPQNEQDPSAQMVPDLERVAAELRQRLAIGCALSVAEREHIRTMLAMVQGQIERRGGA